MFADENKYWIGSYKGFYFKTSNLSTILAYPTSTLAAAAGAGLKVNILTTGGSTETYVIPLFNVAST